MVMNKRSFTLFAAVGITLFPLLGIAADLDIDVRFSSDEISIIRAWYDEHEPAARGKKDRHRQLPPGIARNLARGKALPPGIAKQVLPGDLAGRLPPVRDGYERVVVDGKVLLVDVATRIIHDVLTDIILD
jgi:hypothetical protein